MTRKSKCQAVGRDRSLPPCPTSPHLVLISTRRRQLNEASAEHCTPVTQLPIHASGRGVDKWAHFERAGGGEPLTNPSPSYLKYRGLASKGTHRGLRTLLIACSQVSRPTRKPGSGIACGVTRRPSWEPGESSTIRADPGQGDGGAVGCGPDGGEGLAPRTSLGAQSMIAIHDASWARPGRRAGRDPWPGAHPQG